MVLTPPKQIEVDHLTVIKLIKHTIHGTLEVNSNDNTSNITWNLQEGDFYFLLVRYWFSKMNIIRRQTENVFLLSMRAVLYGFIIWLHLMALFFRGRHWNSNLSGSLFLFNYREIILPPQKGRRIILVSDHNRLFMLFFLSLFIV